MHDIHGLIYLLYGVIYQECLCIINKKQPGNSILDEDDENKKVYIIHARSPA